MLKPCKELKVSLVESLTHDSVIKHQWMLLGYKSQDVSEIAFAFLIKRMLSKIILVFSDSQIFFEFSFSSI